MKILHFSFFAFCLVGNLWAQTAPTPQAMPFTVDFGTTTFTTMPTGTAAWNGIDGGVVNSQTLAEATTPTGNAGVTARTTSTTTGGCYGYASAGSGNGRLYIQTSSNATNGASQLAAAVTLSAGNTTINISYDIETVLLGTSNRTFGLVLQYRAGTTGAWTTVSGSEVEYTPSSANGGDNDIAGDVDSYAQSVSGLTAGDYQFRFAIWRGPSASGAGNSAGGAFDNLSFTQSGSAPVTLSYIDVKSLGKSILLSFATATEHNNAHFEIERSADGRTFEKIGQVAGNGNSTAFIHYTFEDKAPLNGINYYRLRQVDLDGESTYSPVRSIVFGDTKNVVLFPTPVSETMTVQLDKAYSSDASWQIMDITGRILSEGIFAAEQNTFTIPVHTLTEGTYVLRMIANQTAITKQFRKL